jgi:hypothetical protein
MRFRLVFDGGRFDLVQRDVPAANNLSYERIIGHIEASLLRPKFLPFGGRTNHVLNVILFQKSQKGFLLHCGINILQIFPEDHSVVFTEPPWTEFAQAIQIGFEDIVKGCGRHVEKVALQQPPFEEFLIRNEIDVGMPPHEDVAVGKSCDKRGNVRRG